MAIIGRYFAWHRCASIAIVGTVAMQGGCATLWTKDDRAVTERCLPLSDLLAKSYNKGASINTIIAKFSFEVRRNQVVLSSTEIERIAAIDVACRAWAHHVITNDEYISFLLETYGQAIAQKAVPEERAAAVTKSVGALVELKAKGAVPESLDVAKMLGPEVERAVSRGAKR